MRLNESKGNMYEWITHTGNTIKGKCPHGCNHCYMEKWGKQSELHLDEKELSTPTPEGNFIFVGFTLKTIFSNKIFLSLLISSR